MTLYNTESLTIKKHYYLLLLLNISTVCADKVKKLNVSLGGGEVEKRVGIHLTCDH